MAFDCGDLFAAFVFLGEIQVGLGKFRAPTITGIHRERKRRIIAELKKAAPQ
jgi:hypothetical protein